APRELQLRLRTRTGVRPNRQLQSRLGLRRRQNDSMDERDRVHRQASDWIPHARRLRRLDRLLTDAREYLHRVHLKHPLPERLRRPEPRGGSQDQDHTTEVTRVGRDPECVDVLRSMLKLWEPAGRSHPVHVTEWFSAEMVGPRVAERLAKIV